MFVTDDRSSDENLVGGFDQDSPTERILAIRWDVEDDFYKDFHIYTEINGAKEVYIARTRSGEVNLYEWRPGAVGIHSDYVEGPQFGNEYRFIVYGLRLDGTILRVAAESGVLFLSDGDITPTLTPAETNTPAPTATATVTNTPTPTFTPEATYTATPTPTATRTPEPTVTPTITPTPNFPVGTVIVTDSLMKMDDLSGGRG